MRYQIPWSAMMPVAGMTLLVMSMDSLLAWHERTFVTGGKVRWFLLFFVVFLLERAAVSWLVA